MGDVKEIITTDAYNSMDENIRGCQTESSYEDCVTQKYLKILKNKCKCLPFNLQNYSSAENKVHCLKNKLNCIDSHIKSRLIYALKNMKQSVWQRSRCHITNV